MSYLHVLTIQVCRFVNVMVQSNKLKAMLYCIFPDCQNRAGRMSLMTLLPPATYYMPLLHCQCCEFGG